MDIDQNEENYRMVMHKDDIEIITKDKEYLKGKAAIDYLKEQGLKSMTITETVPIGTRIKLKKFDDVLVITNNNSKPMKYYAYIEGTPEELYCFGQQDIEKILPKYEYDKPSISKK